MTEIQFFFKKALPPAGTDEKSAVPIFLYDDTYYEDVQNTFFIFIKIFPLGVADRRKSFPLAVV